MFRAMLIVIFLALSAVAFADETPHTISVDGRGFVNIRPDMARLSLSVEERDTSLSTAQRAVADVAENVLELLEDVDIEDRHINSTGATVHPNYRWNREAEEQELIGYIVRRRIDVEIRDLDVLGEIIDGAVRAGVNQVSPPALDSTTRRDAYRDALAKAVADARKNAGALADEFDVDVGAVMHVSAGQFFPPMPMPVARSGSASVVMAEASVGPETYNPGEMRVDASVSVVFAIDD